MSVNHVELQKALQDFVCACTGLSDAQVIWGAQQGVRPVQPTINLRLMFLSDHNRPWLDAVTNYLEITPLVISGVSGNTFTTTTHGRTTGDGPFRLVGADLPTGVSEETDYWLIVTGATTFQLATTYQNARNGVVITLSDAGSGVMTLEDTDTTLAYGQEIRQVQRSLQKAVLTAEMYTNTGTGDNMAQAVLNRINSKRLLPSIMDILQSKNVSVIEVDRVRFIGGKQDLVLFEPRAIVDIHLHFVSEEEEYGQVIESTEITNETTGNEFTVQ